MTFAEQWSEIERRLPARWTSAEIALEVSEDEHADRAALILASLAPGRRGSTFRVAVEPARNPARILARLDGEGVRGRLDLVEASKEGTETEGKTQNGRVATTTAHEIERPRALVEQWDELMRRLPPDWSDLYAELELDSTDYLERGALLLAPVNPAHYGGRRTFRFRCARDKGYGVYTGMARRCLERLDGEHITGRARALRVLSQTSLVATQGPVWRVGGRAV